MLFTSTHSAKTICTNKKKEADNMAHEKHYEVWENMTAEMVDSQFWKTFSNGSAIARLRESGFLAYNLKAEFDSMVNANKYPLRIEGVKMADRWGFPTARKFKNATELKSYVKNYGRSTLLNHYIYDKDNNRIGMISKDQSHLYKKRPKKIPAKYTVYGTVYDWGILNDCHC